MGINIEKLKERFDKKTTERSDRLNLKDADNYLRLLPPSIDYFSEDVDYIAYEFLVHFNLGIEGDKKAEVCPKTLGKNQKCPICEAVYKLYKTNSVEDRTLAGSIRAKMRYIFNVLNLEDLDKGVQVLEIGPKIYEKIVIFETNKKYGDLLDIDKGRNITITKTSAKESSSGYVEYDLIPDPDITSIRTKLPKNYKESITLLKKQVPTPKSYAELKATLEGDEYIEQPKEVDENVEKDDKTEVRGNKHIDEEIEGKKEESQSKKKMFCFGEDYGPKRDACLKCIEKVECRRKFLTIDFKPY